MSRKNPKQKWEQLSVEGIAIGLTVRTDDGEIGKIAKVDRRNNVTVKFDNTELPSANVKFDKLEVDYSIAVKMSDIPADEKQPKVAPVRERKAVITRIVGGREYNYQNLGGGHIDNGDAIATALRGKTLDEVYAHTASVLGVDEAKLRTTYASNNLGRQRMTLGNLLRSHAKSVEAGATYVPPFMASEVKAANKVARETKAAEAKAAKEAKVKEKADALAATKAEREAKAAEAKAAKEAKDAAAKAEREAKATAKKAAAAAAAPATTA